MMVSSLDGSFEGPNKELDWVLDNFVGERGKISAIN
jgi:hypothetical protein